MTRRKSSFRRQNSDEASGLAGWMYTDLLLGLAVVFLGSIGVVVLAASDPPQDPGVETLTAEGETNVENESEGVSTSSTSSTSTVPIEMCSVLYKPSENSDDGLKVEIPGRPSAEGMAQDFQKQMLERLEDANETLPDNVEPFRFRDVDIAIALLYHGPKDGNWGNVESERIFGELKAAFPDQFRDSVGRYMKITSGQVRTTIEVFLVYERPCNQTG